MYNKNVLFLTTFVLETMTHIFVKFTCLSDFFNQFAYKLNIQR